MTLEDNDPGHSHCRLAILNSHPMPYQLPIYRGLSNDHGVDLTVYYCTRFGVEKSFDPLFGVHRMMHDSVLSGYSHKFLRNLRSGNKIFRPLDLVNPGIVVELFRGKYDCLWLHSYHFLTYMLALVTARIRGTSILYRAEHSLTYDQRVRRPRLVRILKPLLLRFLFRQVRCFLAIGSLNREFYRQYGVPDERIFDVPYSIDNEYFAIEAQQYRADRDEVRARMGIGKDDVVFVFAAKLIEQKAPMQMLQAYAKVHATNKALIVVGDGALRRRAEAFVSDNNLSGVHFLGYVENRELPRIYAISDVFLRPDGIYIGDWGLTVNEAMASGLAVIATDSIAATADLVKDGFNGFVVKYNDVDNLADAMERVATDKDCCDQMGRHSSELIAKWSSKEAIEGVLRALEYCRQGR